MNIKLLSALAKSHFAISEEGVTGYFPLMQSVIRGAHELKTEKLADDDFEPAFDDEDELESTEPQADTYTGRIAVMRVTGVLMHYGGMCSYGTEDYANRINNYLADESVSGLIVLLDSPGGQVEGIETLREAVVNFAANKPLISLVNDGRMASGAVWGFGASTEVYSANALCMIGSVGVMATLLDIRKALEKNGIRQVIIRAPQSTDKVKDYTDALDGKTAAIEAELKFICDRFIEVVNTDRAGKLTSEEWNTGKMFFAEDAQRIGLIDGIMNYTQVVARMQELIAQNQKSNTEMFGNKLPKVAALKGAANITAADLEAANEEISAYGIEGVTLVLDSELDSVSASASQVESLNATIAANATEIANLKTDKLALQAKLDKKPAVEPTSVAAEGDTIQDTGAEPEYEKTSVDLEKERMAKEW